MKIIIIPLVFILCGCANVIESSVAQTDISGCYSDGHLIIALEAGELVVLETDIEFHYDYEKRPDGQSLLKVVPRPIIINNSPRYNFVRNPRENLGYYRILRIFGKKHIQFFYDNDGIADFVEIDCA